MNWVCMHFLGDVMLGEMGNTDTSLLPVLLLASAAVSAVAVALFLFGMQVGHRTARGLTPLERPHLFSRKAKEAKNGVPLPRITG